MTGKGRVYVVGGDTQVASIFFKQGFEIMTGDNALEKSDIVVFIGGADINPELYNQKINPAARVHPSANADKRDLEAWALCKPEQLKLGICRGGQLMNVLNGGSMIQHVSGHGSGPHKVYDTVWNKEVVVSSCHHQMMIPTDEAHIFAYSEGIGNSALGEHGPVSIPEQEPEVLWYEKTKSLCYQGHPEWTPKEGAQYFFDLVGLVNHVQNR